jgi:hypothetical protein
MTVLAHPRYGSPPSIRQADIAQNATRGRVRSNISSRGSSFRISG